MLEIGCGRGDLTVYLAKSGAEVTAVDFSAMALEKTRSLAAFNGVADRVSTHQLDALQLPSLGIKFDLVVGKFILHHIEPFSAFTEVLDELLTDNGRAVFMENNARNPLLMFARKNFSGRYGIPKHGDDEEYPLEHGEIALLQERFEYVEQIFPEFTFFRKLNTYVFQRKRRFSWIMKFNKWMDASIYRALPPLRKYSYLQILEVKKGR